MTELGVKIKSYFTVTIDGFYLTYDITFISFKSIQKYLTKNIEDIPNDLLFSDYGEAIKYERMMFERHNLLRINNDVKIIRINKLEGIEYDR